MSEQQSQSDRPAATNTEQEGPDDREPTPERQAELRAAYEANVAAGRAPYEGVYIPTRGELRWVMEERRWSGNYFPPHGYESANLSGANLSLADLSGATLINDDLSGADLSSAKLDGANLRRADLSGANLSDADLSGADLMGATLSGAVLYSAKLDGAYLSSAKLDGAYLSSAKLDGAKLIEANLSGADLRSALMDATTELRDARLDTHTCVADVVWNGVPLTRLNWQDVAMLGEETLAREPHYRPNYYDRSKRNKKKDKATRLTDYADAVLANRQVATVLRSQGLNEHADRFAYRAQLCQRPVLRLQRHYLRYLGSLFLGLIAGYGYRPMRSVATYVLVVLAFAGAYLLNAQFAAPHLRWDEALVLSISAFHGRGFFTTGISLGDTLARLAAGEAIIGLLIEITFIATFTQRFFAR